MFFLISGSSVIVQNDFWNIKRNSQIELHTWKCFPVATLCDDVSFCGFQAEYRLQMEAQHISLSQIHAAQLELLQEETDARSRTLGLKLQELRDHGDQGG